MVTHITRLMIKNLIPGIDDGAQGDVHRLAHPHSDQHLRGRIVAETVIAGQVTRDGAAQLQQPVVGSVTGPTPLQRVNTGLADMPGSDKSRLTHPERNDVVHGLNDVEKVANPRARDGTHVVGNEITLCFGCLRHSLPKRTSHGGQGKPSLPARPHRLPSGLSWIRCSNCWKNTHYIQTKTSPKCST